MGLSAREQNPAVYDVDNIDPPAVTSERHDVTVSAPITKRTMDPTVMDKDGVDSLSAIRELPIIDGPRVFDFTEPVPAAMLFVTEPSKSTTETLPEDGSA